MRGCLFVVVLAGAVLAAALGLGGPVLAATVVRASLEGAGLESSEPAEVAVRLASPLDLLGGRAEAVAIRIGVGRTETLRWEAASVELLDVDLVGRQAETIRVDLDRPGLPGESGGGLVADRLTAEGPLHDAAARIVVPIASFQQHVRLAVGRPGAIPPDLSFVAPDLLVSADGSFGARLLVENGGLQLDPGLPVLPTVEVFRPDPAVPFALTGAGVEGERLVLLGRLDLTSWLG